MSAHCILLFVPIPTTDSEGLFDIEPVVGLNSRPSGCMVRPDGQVWPYYDNVGDSQKDEFLVGQAVQSDVRIMVDRRCCSRAGMSNAHGEQACPRYLVTFSTRRVSYVRGYGADY